MSVVEEFIKKSDATKGYADAANRAITPEEQERFAKLEAEGHLNSLDLIENMYNNPEVQARLSEEDKKNFEETIKFNRVEVTMLMEQAEHAMDGIADRLSKATENVKAANAEIASTVVENSSVVEAEDPIVVLPESEIILDKNTLGYYDGNGNFHKNDNYAGDSISTDSEIIDTNEVLPEGFVETQDGTKSR